MSDRLYRYGAVSLGLVSATIGYGAVGALWGVGLAVLLALLWFYGLYRGWPLASTLSFFLVSVLAAVGLLAGIGMIWASIAVVGALVAWEAEHFRRFLAQASNIHAEADLVKRHDRRLLLVAAVGLALAVLTTVIEVNLGFGLALLLSIISLAGISRAVQFLRD